MSEIKMNSKDVIIARQSQSKLVLDFFILHGITPSVLEFQRVLNIFTEAIIIEPNGALNDKFKALDNWLNEKKTTKTIILKKPLNCGFLFLK